MTVGEKIRQYRLAKGLTQKELGRLSETAETTVRQYEGGKRTPRIDQIEKLAAALDINPISLMGWGFWDAKHPETLAKWKQEEAFDQYLLSLGYRVVPDIKPGNPHLEAQTDDSGKIQGYAKVDEEETLESISITKEKLTANFTPDEFNELQGKYFEFIEKVKELEADYQAIIESRIKRKAEK